MKQTVKIADIYFSDPIENKESGIKNVICNISTVEKVEKFKKDPDNEDIKILKKVNYLDCRLSDFKRIVVLDDTLAIVEDNVLSEEESKLSEKDRYLLQYKNQIRCLKGATLTFEKECVYEPELNEDGEEVKDEEGKAIKKLIGFGETTFIKLELSQAGTKLAEKLAFGE